MVAQHAGPTAHWSFKHPKDDVKANSVSHIVFECVLRSDAVYFLYRIGRYIQA